MSPFNFINLLVGLFLFCVALPSSATSASSAQIYIEPVTYNDNGAILFKAFKKIDYTGAASGQIHSYWWLVVSEKKQWEETLHVLITQPEGSTSDKSDPIKDLAFNKYQNKTTFYANEFENGFDWDNPPKTILPLIKKYGFKQRDGFNKNEGQGTVSWSSKGVCVNVECSKDPVPQRTIGNKISRKSYTNIEFQAKEMIRVEVPPVSCIFYHAGVALFKNGNYEIINGKYEVSDTKQHGAEFYFNLSEKNGEMIDYNFIDAIAILPHEILQK